MWWWPHEQVKKAATVIPRNSLIEANQSGLIAEPLIDITPQLPIPDYKVLEFQDTIINRCVACAARPPLTSRCSSREGRLPCPIMPVGFAGSRSHVTWMTTSMLDIVGTCVYVLCSQRRSARRTCMPEASERCCRRVPWTWSVKRRARWCAARATSKGSQVCSAAYPGALGRCALRAQTLVYQQA